MATTTSTSNGRLEWSHEMRLVLHLSSTEFNARGEKRARIFNGIFAGEIAAGGYANGIGANALTSQWGEREKKPYWRPVLEPDNTQNRALRDSVRAQIRAAIGGSSLQQSPRVTSSTSQVRPRLSSARSVNRGREVAESDNDDQTIVVGQKAAPPVYPPPTTPLSKRPAIAYWAPESPNEADEDDLRQGASKRRRVADLPTSRALIPVISKQEIVRKKATLPLTPSKTPKATGREKRAVAMIKPPKTTVIRNDGTTINVGEKIIKRMERPLEPIPEDLARPPMPGLFYRCWDKKTPNDHNSEDGFWARLYHKSNVIDIEPFISHFWIYNHIDKKPAGTELLKSPYISVSSGLVWLLRKSLKLAAKGESHQRVSVISSKVLNSKAVFWVPPLHASTLGPAPYHCGAQLWTGAEEWLCWRDIPGPAIIHTFSIQQLKQFCYENKNVGSLLRLAKLPESKYANMRRALKADKVALDLQSATAIADLAVFMGIDADSCTTHNQALVCEVVRGCCLHLTYHTEKEWQRLASAFSQALIKATEGFNDFGQQVKIEHAFLEGIFWGCGDVNPKTTKEKTDAIARKARSLGLGNPSQIMTRKLDSMKMGLLMDSKAAMKRVNSYHEKLLAIEPRHDTTSTEVVQDYPETEEEDADSMIAGPSRRVRGPLPPRTGFEEDDVSDYEFGDDGFIV